MQEKALSLLQELLKKEITLKKYDGLKPNTYEWYKNSEHLKRTQISIALLSYLLGYKEDFTIEEL